MSISNQSLSNIEEDTIVPLDLYYANFLKALSEIHDESMRDRCHKYWTSLYRYFTRSVNNEQALILEEKRLQEILQRLNMDIDSRQSEMAYQVRNILQRGEQILEDIPFKYRTKANRLNAMEDNQIPIERSEERVASNVQINPSFTIREELLKTIDHLKSNIKDLQIIRKTMETERNLQRETSYSLQIKLYQINQNAHRMSGELLEVQDELKGNLQAIDEHNSQLKDLHLYRENLGIAVDYHSLKEQIDNEEDFISKLREENRRLNQQLFEQISLIKIEKNERWKLETKRKDLLEKIQLNHEEIQREKATRQELFRMEIQLKKDLKRKQKILSVHQQQITQFQNKIIELEHQRDLLPKHPHPLPPLDGLKTSIHQHINDRLKLSMVHHDLKDQIHTLHRSIDEHALLVKDQRRKILNYEKLHDRWILHININRKRLLDSFNRAHTLTNHIAKTKDFLENFHRIQFDFKPDSLILYHQLNSFIEQRKENPSTSPKASFHLQSHQLKKRLQINRITFDQITENLLLINQDQSFLFNQISHINSNRFHLIEYLQSLDNKSHIIHEQISCLRKKIDQRRHSIEGNEGKLQRLTGEKEQIVRFLLEKQHWIIRLTKHLQSSEKILRKSRWNLDELCSKLKPIRLQIIGELNLMNSFDRRDQIDYKQMIFFLRKQVLQTRKKKIPFQHRQILTKISLKKNQSIRKHDKQDMDLQEKASSIIHRLIRKTAENIRLHQRFDFLMINLLVLYSTIRNSSIIDVNPIVNSFRWTNQIQSSIAELRVLKIEVLFYENILNKLRTMVEKKTGNRLSDV